MTGKREGFQEAKLGLPRRFSGLLGGLEEKLRVVYHFGWVMVYDFEPKHLAIFKINAEYDINEIRIGGKIVFFLPFKAVLVPLSLVGF